MEEPTKKKIFISAIGSLGDVKPFVILAKELKKRGHIVWLGVHQRFEEQVKAEGLDTVLIGGDLEITFSTTPDGIELQRNPSVFKINLIKRVFLPLMEEWFNGILNGLKDADLLIVSVMSIIPALSCLQKSEKTKAIGIFSYPCLRTNEFAPPALSGKSESSFNWVNSMKWKMFEYGAASMYTDTINQLRAKHNLPPVNLRYEQLVEAAVNKQMITATIYSKYLIPRPADWAENHLLVGPIFEPQTDQIPTIPSDLEEILDKWANEKIIYVGIGSMMSIMFGKNEQMQFLGQIQSCLRQMKIKTIFSLVGFQDLDQNSPTNEESIFYLKQTIPHSWLFPKISAAIHHGGAGTTHASLRHGLPTLILPFGADQPFNADRVALNRLGPKPIPIKELTVNKLTAAIQDLLDNFTLYRNNARKIGPLMESEDGLERCIQIIEKELI